MTFYIARRLFWMMLVVLIVLGIVFAVFFLLPAGDPALRFAGKQPSDQLLQEIRHRLGFDKAWYVQFWRFVKNFFAGDQYGWPGLGYSYLRGDAVLTEITNRASRTLWLIFGASILWLVFGVAVGVVSAVKRRTWIDRLAMGSALVAISAPVFVVGPLLLLVVWQYLNLTGGTGYRSPASSISGFLSHMILPWLTLAVLYIGIYARMTRKNLLETLGEDYIRTARAKGLSERRVIFRHGLRASLTAVVTMFGLDIALLVGGAVITESIFNLQGLGFLAVDSALQQDLPTVIGVTLLTAFAVALMNLVVDVIYAFLDPRIRYA